MVHYKCRNCGGEVNIGESGGFLCPYCGSKSFMSDADFKGNEIFRKKLVEYYKAEADNKEYDYDSDTLWQCNGEESFVLENGQNLNIKYMHKYNYDSFSCYLAKESVVYIFDNEKEKRAFLTNLSRLDFPEADTKLPRCFPKLKMDVDLKNGKKVLAFIRRPNFYPVELFAPLESVHLAWVISRMENLCCALKFSGIEFGRFDMTAVWINPITHEGALFGDWTKVKDISDTKDLTDIRRTAIEIAENARNPIEMYEFLNTKPKTDAYQDFSSWDEVIEKGFGGHKFKKM